MELTGLTALVTGASRGLGRAVVHRLAARGVRVGINYCRRRDLAEEAVSAIRAAGGQAAAIPGDVGVEADARRMVAETEAALGPIDLLVNNAGIFRRGTLEDYNPDDLAEMRRINVDGVIFVTAAVVPGMKQRGQGRIVNLASIAAHGTTMAGTTMYAATKAAVIALTRRFALELGPYGISVNALAPGFIVTDMVYQGRTLEEARAMLEATAAKAMLRQVGKPEDIATAVEFLLAQDFLTAQVLTVDGGRTDYTAHPG